MSPWNVNIFSQWGWSPENVWRLGPRVSISRLQTFQDHMTLLWSYFVLALNLHVPGKTVFIFWSLLMIFVMLRQYLKAGEGVTGSGVQYLPCRVLVILFGIWNILLFNKIRFSQAPHRWVDKWWNYSVKLKWFHFKARYFVSLVSSTEQSSPLSVVKVTLLS